MEELIKAWRAEQECAHIHGWDFSHIEGRYTEEDTLPWDYKACILKNLNAHKKLLDIDTGGGEFLLSLNHVCPKTYATENYPPNVLLCEERLSTLGIIFKQADGKGVLPFESGSFDIVINRHGDLNVGEIHRVLKTGGLFITQQVGAENDRELVKLLIGEDEKLPFPDQYLGIIADKLLERGFEILEKDEHFGTISFYDVGALVWFARIIEWEFPHFSVDGNLEQLKTAQRLLERNGKIEGRTHRFFIVCKKKR